MNLNGTSFHDACSTSPFIEPVFYSISQKISFYEKHISLFNEWIVVET
ncbi:hypothetical protein C2W59_01657 [Bacillus pumilus]|nr:hypothetical protein BAT_3693 [Bacillus pumilus ATCC 7061]RAP12471.1 hypothetical protein C2W58_03378 [Bacillus pumilus]RAP17895.1 hypothetical protein C2W59_01657 [Bacillus pumilus]